MPDDLGSQPRSTASCVVRHAASGWATSSEVSFWPRRIQAPTAHDPPALSAPQPAEDVFTIAPAGHTCGASPSKRT